MTASIDERVRDLIVKQLRINLDQVTPSASFIDDLGANSIDIVELLIVFEEEFGIDIPDEDAEKLVRVSDVVKYVTENNTA